VRNVQPGKHALGGDGPSPVSELPASELAPGRRTLSAELGHRNIGAASSVPGRHALTDRIPLQLKRIGHGSQASDPHAVAAQGVENAGASLPHLEQIQESFGHHDVSTVRAGVGGSAETSARELDASAYAYGDRVAFAASPDLHTAAHEAAHVVQQRGGVADLAGGVGGAGDQHEQHADAVADAVVAGKSAEALLDERAGEGGASAHAIQRKEAEPSVNAADYVQSLFASIVPQVMTAIHGIKMVPLGPFGASLGADYETALVDYLHRVIGGENAGDLLGGFQMFAAPESLVPLVDRARGHDWDYTDESHPKEDRASGPASATYASPVAVEIANAIARRYIVSAMKLVPIVVDRWVRFMTELGVAYKQDPRTITFAIGQHPDWLGDIPAAHPMDRAVKLALGDGAPAIDFKALATPALWEKWTKYEDGRHSPDHVEIPHEEPPLRQVDVAFKAKEGKFHWVEASKPDATAEEVAATLFKRKQYGTRDEATQHAYRLIPVPPLWGFHGEDIPKFAPEARQELTGQLRDAYHAMPLEPDGTHQMPAWPHDIVMYTVLDSKLVSKAPPEPVDPISELANDPDRALARASANAKPEQTAGKDAASVVAKLIEDLRVVDAITRSLSACDDDLAAAFSAHDKLHATLEEWQMMSLPDPGVAHALAAQQGAVLVDISEGVGDAAIKYQMYAKPSDDSPPDPTIVELLREAIAPFNDALRAIQFPEVAAQRVQLGLQRTQQLDISIQEASLHSGLTKVDAQLHRDADPFDAAVQAGAAVDAARRTNQLAYDLGATRMQMASKPGDARKQLADQAVKVNDLEFDIDLGDKLGQLNYFWRLVNNEEDFWEGINDYANGLALKQKCLDLRAKFETTVKDRYDAAKKANNRDEMMAARQAFADLIKNEFIPMATAIRDFINRAEKHKKWAKIIAGIVIAIAAFALGQWELDAMLLAGAGWIEAGVAAGIVTTTTSIVLEKLILNQDPTLGSIIMGFAGNIGTFMYVGRLAMIAKAAGVAAEVGEATAGAAARSAELAGAVDAGKSGAIANALKGFANQVFVGGAIMMASAEGQSLIDNKRILTPAEMLEAGTMAVINIIGMKVGQFAFDKTIDAFKLTMKGSGGAQFDQLIAMRQELVDAGNKLHEAAGGDTLAKGKAPPRAQAQELYEKWQAYFEKEREVTQQLLELAEKHPELFRGKGKELDELRAHEAEGEALNRKLRQARALMGVEEMAPGLFRADPKALDAILAEHKASGSEVTDVTTDPVTGLRTLRIVTADGTAVELIEKMADVGERKPPKVPVGEALHFEQWLSERPVDTPENVKIRSRLTEYYARDPEAAIALAQRYGYAAMELATPELMPGVENPPQPLGPELPPEQAKPDAAKGAKGVKGAKGADGPAPDVKPGAPADKSAAQRAYEHYQYQREGRNQSTFGDEFTMDQSDFEKFYKAGYEYDPIAEKWVTRPDADVITTRAGGTLLPEIDPTTPTRSLGEVHSEAVGHELMRKLVSGESEALRLVGIEPPPGYDSRANEWGLGRTKDGKIVLIRGEKGRVDWSLVPGVEDIAHSHPLLDPQTGKPRLLKGDNGNGVIDINALKAGKAANEVDLIHLMPSTGDLWWVAVKGAGKGGHRVYTPYSSLGEGKIGNPIEGAPPVEIEIVEAQAVGLWSEQSTIVVYKGKLRFWAGDTPIGEIELYQKVVGDGANRGDWPTIEPPDTLAPLPPDHPMAPNTATDAAKRPKPLGNVSADRLANLIRMGMPEPTKGSPLEAALGRLRPEQIDLIDNIAHRDNVKDFKNWLHSFADDPSANSALKQLEQARQALLDDPDIALRFERDGTPRWEGDGKKPAKGARQETAQEAQARIANEKAALGDARARAIKAIEQRQPKLLGNMEQWMENVENGLGGGKNATPFFDELAGRPEIDFAKYRPAAEDFLANNRVAPAQKRAIMERSLSPEVGDPAKFLADAKWLADRSELPEARANLLDSASRGMLDLEWLRTLTDLSPAELDALGARSNVAWNKMQIASEYEARRVAGMDRDNMSPSEKRQQTIDAKEAGRANKAVNPSIRGVAGELEAKKIAMPGDFKIVSRGAPEADGLEPDYLLQDPQGREADLEVKANAPDTFKEQLTAAQKGQPDEGIQRMIKQLKASRERTDPKGRPRKSYLAVSDELDPATQKMLESYLRKRGAMPDKILFMKEADILEAGRLMRKHLGIRQGGEE
jgi:hypothetical protein